MYFIRFKLPLACLVMCVVGVAGMTLTHFVVAGPDDKKQVTPEQPVKKPEANGADDKKQAAPEQPVKRPKVDDAIGDLALKLKGKWINVNEKPRAAKRVVIENKDDKDKTNQGWTVLTPVLAPTVDQDWEGERLKLHMLLETDVGGGAKDTDRVVCGFATWANMDRGKKLADFHMTFRMKGELLVVDTYAIYTGDFFPQHWQCEYKKEK